MTIKSFDKKNANLLLEETVAALQPVAEKYGLRVVPAGGSIADLEFTGKVKFIVDDPVAKAGSAKREFEQYCMLFDMTPQHFGATFMNNGKEYRISGLNMTNRQKRFPIKGTNVETGKEMLFTQEVVKKFKLPAA